MFSSDNLIQEGDLIWGMSTLEFFRDLACNPHMTPVAEVSKVGSGQKHTDVSVMCFDDNICLRLGQESTLEPCLRGVESFIGLQGGNSSKLASG